MFEKTIGRMFAVVVTMPTPTNPPLVPLPPEFAVVTVVERRLMSPAICTFAALEPLPFRVCTTGDDEALTVV